jgi:hypothetical protein
MASYTKGHKVIFVLLWKENNVQIYVRVTPSTDSIFWIVKHFKETECVCDKLAYLFVRNSCFVAALEAPAKRPGKACDI